MKSTGCVLCVQDYRPTIFYPRRTTKPDQYATFAEQCERQHVPFLSYMPSEAHLITNAYNLVIDALLGCGYRGRDCGYRGPTLDDDIASVVQIMVKSDVPIISIDVPSGNQPSIPTRSADK